MVADGLPDPGVQKGPEVAVDRLPRRKRRRRRHVAPLASRAHDIEQTVQQAPHVGRPGPPAGLRRRQKRLDQAVLVIAQGLTGTKVSNQCAISRRPHRSLRNGNLSIRTAINLAFHPCSKEGGCTFKTGIDRVAGGRQGAEQVLALDLAGHDRSGRSGPHDQTSLAD